ncbi:hypothetical protein HYH02_009576 [Chlamydomonas schloesseri]|uniref:Uncharacterized protein n=1 Tax=Chlamydomonas schloesseri TaxID=2026947 RepID=A0A835TCX0_9CHLO|nr:hypothetical protein HYH02_009576 [Chlamydomonas schloesseri]|eukprot:KAG2443167.1 hypothetical protein HYH02_009576 [Chlamydomonas schloesseri]
MQQQLAPRCDWRLAHPGAQPGPVPCMRSGPARRAHIPARSASDGAASINIQISLTAPSKPETPGPSTVSSTSAAQHASAAPTPQRAAASNAAASVAPASSPPSASTSASASAATGSSPGPGPQHHQQQQEEAPTGLWGRVKRFFTGSKLDKQRLAALGFGAFSAYGVISNINAGILITISWLTVVRTTGLTPLDAGNWPKFLAIYAGLWVGSNFLRPIRLTLALAAAPLFDGAITAVSKRTGLPKVPAFAVMLFFIAIGTTSLLVTTIAALGGFPPGCRMPWQALA